MIANLKETCASTQKGNGCSCIYRRNPATAGPLSWLDVASRQASLPTVTLHNTNILCEQSPLNTSSNEQSHKTYKTYMSTSSVRILGVWPGPSAPYIPVLSRGSTGRRRRRVSTGRVGSGAQRQHTVPQHCCTLHSATHVHAHTPPSPGLSTVLHCVQQHLPLQFSIPKIDMTRPQSLSRSMSCMWFRAVDLRFKTIWPELTLTEILF